MTDLTIAKIEVKYCPWCGSDKLGKITKVLIQCAGCDSSPFMVALIGDITKTVKEINEEV